MSRFTPLLLLAILVGLVVPVEAVAQTDQFDNLKEGQRVEIVLQNNTIFRGEIRWIAGDRLKLDVTYDSTHLQGFLMFKRTDIKRIMLLQTLSDQEKEKILEKKSERLESYEQEVVARRDAQRDAAVEAAQQEPKVEAKVDPKKAAEERARAKREELLAKFPPGANWSPERYADLVGLPAGSRSPEEREFVERYGEWLAANESSGKDERIKLLEKFPPEKGWGPDKHEELRVKELSNLHTGRPTFQNGQRVNNGRTRPPMTDEEKEFYTRFEEWKLALQEFLEAKKAEGAGDAAGTPSGEAAPQEDQAPSPADSPSGEGTPEGEGNEGQ